jgi:hypothetical protein
MLCVQQGSTAAWGKVSVKERRDHCVAMLQGLKADSLSVIVKEVILEPPLFAEAVSSLVELVYKIC